MSKENLPILLSLDPSVRSMGWALVNLNNAAGKDWYDLDNQALWSYGLVTMEPTKHIEYRWREAHVSLQAMCRMDNITPTHFVAEWPTFFDNQRGRIAAQMNYTVGLASMVGYLAAAFSFRSSHITLWTPWQWKGNASKVVTRNRLVANFGDAGRILAKTASDDVIDAIMIARNWLQLFDRNKLRWQHEDKDNATNQKRKNHTSHYAEKIRT